MKKRPSALGITLVVGAIVVGATFGVLHALRSPDADAPLAGVAQPPAAVAQARGADSGADAPGLQPLSNADPAVEFPGALQSLPSAPYKLALDTTRGRLWWVLPTGDAKVSRLYEYTLTLAVVNAYDIPGSGGTGLFSAIDVDDRGHVIFAEGGQVVDFDPATATYSDITLAPSKVTTGVLPGLGSSISDMALDYGGHAFISRFNVANIIEVSLTDGSLEELPVPETFGPVDDIEVVPGSVWVANTSDIAGGPPSHVGILDLTTGKFSTVSGKTSALRAGSRGRVYAVGWSGAGLAEATVAGLSPLPVRWEPKVAATLGTDDVLAVDDRTGAIWLANRTLPGLAKVDSGDWSVRVYDLPVYSTVYHSCPALVSCPDEVQLRSSVRGLAVAPNGDLYFSDATMNRIGVIHAGQ